MNDLYDSVDYNNLKFEYVGPTKDVSFYEYRDSKELFNARNRRNEFLNKLGNIKIGKKKTTKQQGVINNITRF